MPSDAAGTDDDASMNAPDADPAKPDAAARDAGSDASSDAGRDGGTDAGDAGRDADANSDGATDGGELDAQETSVPSDGATDAMPCPEAGCTQTCGPGPTCAYTCLTGMSCTFDCRTATPCNVVCQPGSQCEVVSDLGSQDSVSCMANASCGRVCNDKLNCNFAPCEGGVIGSFFTCTASVNRCNWTCPP
jgi:hypothetical protein